MMLALTIIHVIISVALIIVVLLQHGKQQGLSGAIAGGAETFFGKNKGRTIDAMLKKFTAVIAILFVISSIVLAAVSISDYNASNAPVETTTEDAAASEAEPIQGTLDENGNLVDAEGNILMSAEQVAEAQAQAEAEAAQTEAEAPAEGETAPTEGEAPAESAAPAEGEAAAE